MHLSVRLSVYYCQLVVWKALIRNLARGDDDPARHLPTTPLSAKDRIVRFNIQLPSVTIRPFGTEPRPSGAMFHARLRAVVFSLVRSYRFHPRRATIEIQISGRKHQMFYIFSMFLGRERITARSSNTGTRHHFPPPFLCPCSSCPFHPLHVQRP